MDQAYNQEEEAMKIMLEEMKRIDAEYAESVRFVLSRDVAGSGLLARENASILNAAILDFARKTMLSFIQAMKSVGLQCPLYLTSNAGHLLPYSESMNFPIRIFSSGATNSMRGAAFLAQSELLDESGAVVIDVGGTTSDVGALLPNGYPRLSKTYTNLSGIKINLDMPSVESIGLGGGSRVRVQEDASGVKVTIGPDSVGYALITEALCFGGKTLTATDVAVASSPSSFTTASIGDSALVNLTPSIQEASHYRLAQMLESLVDRIKLTPEDCTVILVGGGAILCPPTLKGVRRVIRSEYAGVANAIGAALAKIFGSAEAMIDADDVKAGVERVKRAAIENAVEKGGSEEEVVVLTEEVKWVPYVEGKKEVRVDVACAADHKRVYAQMVQSSSKDDVLTGTEDESPAEKTQNSDAGNSTAAPAVDDVDPDAVDPSSYRPTITSKGEWLVSATDLKFLEIGCYILGCGGGGSPYATYLALLEQLRQGERLTIINPSSLPDNAVLPPIAAVGTPAVGLERISSDAVFHAIEKLEEVTGKKASCLLACEIGGMNGLATLRWATKRYCDIPAVDGDLMGEYALDCDIIRY
jgi:N-methylhydantoinase A/oxoprolinase/acetone carboxylase beta subunit